MQLRRVLITGGAGFIGSSLGLGLRHAFPDARVVALDNLHRRGSELGLLRLVEAGVEFVHGDVRCPEDLERAGECDLLVHCAAEPSVHAGNDGSPLKLLRGNLDGTLHVLEHCRRHGAALLFFSSSRVYPIEAVNALPWVERADRFAWPDEMSLPGASSHGIAETFPLEGVRSFYGAAKLSAELLIREYVAAYGLRAMIDRCGLVTGPWQMGRVDQGVVGLWVAAHLMQRPLSYIGFGGTGKQVRDVLHVDDLVDLLLRQIERPEAWDGRVVNVGGGPRGAVSLRELTGICREVTGNTLELGRVEGTSAVDVRIYITDNRRAREEFGWEPRRDVPSVVRDTAARVAEHEARLAPVLR